MDLLKDDSKIDQSNNIIEITNNEKVEGKGNKEENIFNFN